MILLAFYNNQNFLIINTTPVTVTIPNTVNTKLSELPVLGTSITVSHCDL